MALAGLVVALPIFAIGVMLLVRNDRCLNEIKMSSLPELTGPLVFSQISGDRLYEGLHGPESIVYENGVIYTCLAKGGCVKLVDGKVERSVKLNDKHDCDGSMKSFVHCGRPLGLRRWNSEKFIVVDASLGVFSIDFEKERSELIYSSLNKVGGVRQKFLDDFDFLDNETIVYSDASTNYGIDQFVAISMEGCRNGRIIKLSLTSGEAKVLVDGFVFPNGIQRHVDGQSILIAESMSAKIHRYYFAGPKDGTLEVFNDNLPGLPDNIRPAADGKSYYVALFALRYREKPSMFDYLSTQPWLRQIAAKIIINLPESLVVRIVEFSSSSYELFVQLDLDGNIIDSYHDKSGKIIYSISQVTDDGGKYLYLGSFSNKHVGRVLKH